VPDEDVFLLGQKPDEIPKNFGAKSVDASLNGSSEINVFVRIETKSTREKKSFKKSY
jgi:hypothetical protein